MFHAPDRMPEGAIGVVQKGSHSQRLCSLGLRRGGEIIGVIQAAQRMKSLFERCGVNTQRSGQAEDFEVIHDELRRELSRKRATAAAALLGVRVHEDEPLAHETTVVIENGIVQVDVALQIAKK